MTSDARYTRLFCEAWSMGLSLADAREWATREYEIRYGSGRAS